jgi:hypothetical protein
LFHLPEPTQTSCDGEILIRNEGRFALGFFLKKPTALIFIYGKFFPTILAGGGKHIYFFFEDFSS